MMFFFDTETYLIRPGRQAPKVVCIQSRQDGREDVIDLDPGRLESALLDPQVALVGHSVAYDAAVTSATWPHLLPLWFDAYSSDRVVCTKVREKLIRIAQGSSDRVRDYSLLGCLKRYKIETTLTEADKSGAPDTWRLRYAELDGIPVDQWPADARRYALADLDVSEVWRAQEEPARARWLEDQYRRARADFWLTLQSAAGMRTDPAAVEAFAAKVELEHAQHRAVLRDAGIVRADGTKDTKAAARRVRAVCAEKGLTVALTKTGRAKVRAGEIVPEGAYTALDADQCAATGDPVMRAYARYGSVGTLRSRVERLSRAGSIPIQPRFDVLKKTGRTSCSKGNGVTAYGDQVQNLNREPGLRECYVARPGRVLVAVDWSAAELHSLAQVCLWMGLRSEMARVLNAGRDPHLHFACTRSSWDYTWAREALDGHHGPEIKKKVKTARQGAKAFNFGFPGGLGIETFRHFSVKTYGVELTEREAQEGKAEWFDAYPEMPEYFRHINDLIESGRPLKHWKSNRYRGALTYCAAANSYFQGHTADMALDAGWRLARYYYGVDQGPLNAARPWNFVHDEHIAEVPEVLGHECAMEIVRIMEETSHEWCPDVPVPAEPSIMRHWRKSAGPVYRDGRLIPYEDRALSDTTIEAMNKDLASGMLPMHVSWKYGVEQCTFS